MSEKSTNKLVVTLLGITSVGLYWLLFRYNQEILQIARDVQNGDKSLFLVPILIAFVFSYVHGAFTGGFWDVLGFKAAKKK